MQSNNDNINQLSSILDKQASWCKFAEAKNAILLGVNGFILEKGYSVLIEAKYSTLNSFMILLPSIISTLILALSFVPILSISRENTKCNCGLDKKNTLFFKDIACFIGKERLYLKLLFQSQSKFSKTEIDYAHQIIALATISTQKFQLFQVAFYCLLGLPFIIVGMLIFS